MGKAYLIQSNFTKGEITDSLRVRGDNPLYQESLAKLENFLIMTHGGVTRRPGTRYVGEVKNSNKKALLVPFRFNVKQSYILEFGEQYIRFYKDGGQIQSGGSPVEVATPYLESELDELQFAQSADVLYITHQNYKPRKLIRLSHTEWYMTKIIFNPPPTHEADTDISGGSATLTPAATTGTGINFTASSSVFLQGDVGRYIIFEGTNNSKLFSRAKITSYTSGTVVVADILDDFPDTNPIAAGDWLLRGSPVTLATVRKAYPAGVAAKIKSFDTTLPTGVAINTFRSTDVGKYIKIWGGVVKIDSFVSATEVKGILLSELDVPSTNIGTSNNVSEEYRGSWTLEVESWDATLKYPKAVVFYEGRFYLASSLAFPYRLWGSKVNDFENMAVGFLDDDGIQWDIFGGQVNTIEWLSFTNSLVVGCFGGEFRVLGGSNPLSPSNFQVKPDTEHGSVPIQPIRPSNGFVFVQRDRMKLRESTYSFDVDMSEARDLTILSEHIVGSGISEIAYQQEPNSIVWVVTKDGHLAALTYEKNENIFGWSKHRTGRLSSNDSGFLGNPVYTAYFENIAVIPHPSVDKDQVWFVVKRLVNGSWKRYIEYFDDDGVYYDQLNSDCALTWGYDIFYGDGSTASFTAGFDIQNSSEVEVYLDGVLQTITTDYTVVTGTDTVTFTSAPDDRAKIQFYNTRTATTVSGLGHLEGETVDVVGDGAVQGQKTVSSGSITLDAAASKIEIGLPYTSQLETLEPEIAGNTLLPRSKTWNLLVFHLKDSLGMKISNAQPRDSLYTPTQYTIPFRTTDMAMDAPPDLFNGEKEFRPQGWDNKGRMLIEQDQPLPLTILGMSGLLDIGD